jgi:serine/threonine-protein kinase
MPDRFPPGIILAQRYRIFGRLGKGGMGEVYRAFDLILEQDVALKFLSSDFASRPDALDRFRAEVRLARQVSHPNICRVYDIGQIDDAPFLSMEYVDGEDLASLLRRIGRVPADKALDIAHRLCAGLAAAHEKGVLHRDLKPANIMIDGRGEVLIADFGLAAASGSIEGTEARQGTPAYQAPEQLAGLEATTQSDIYALGLVLYETFTGRRAFEADSFPDLVRLQQSATPPSIVSIAKDVDPAIERAIFRCLMADPKKRPASVRAVAALLPGGDPLAAALAAGETPSPEMVANSGAHAGLRPIVALSLLATVLVTTIAAALVLQRVTVEGVMPADKAPEELAGIAREYVRRGGYSARPAGSAFGFSAAKDYFDYAPSHYSAQRIWTHVAQARPTPAVFWYRQSPETLDPGFELSVSQALPAFDVPGMIRIRLDLEGRLLSFEALPPAIDSGNPTSEPFDWKPWFEMARLDPAAVQPTSPEWVIPMAFDTRLAWKGAWPEAPEVPVRIEAAAWRGKPVSFRIVEPWTAPTTKTVSGFSPLVLLYLAFGWFLVFPVACWIAVRNIRRKRADIDGALKLAALTLVLTLLSTGLSMVHVASLREAARLVLQLGWAMTNALFLGTCYVALEPFVRSRSPHVLISWARVMRGQFADPLVATHILKGMAISCAVTLWVSISFAVRFRSGVPPTELAFPGFFWLGPRQFAGDMFTLALYQLWGCHFFLFLFFLGRLVVRRDDLAGAAIFVFGIVVDLLMPPPPGMLVWDLVIWAVWAIVLARYGFVAILAAFFGGQLLSVLTLNSSRWYFGYSLAGALLVFGGTVWASRNSLAGRALLRDETFG